jgi:hypothetical protein
MATPTLKARRVVVAPPITPTRFGLSTVAQVRDDVDEHWLNGVVWHSPACQPLGVTTDQCVTGVKPAAKTPVGCVDLTEADAFTVYAYDLRSTAGRTEQEALDWVRALLEAGEWAAVEAHVGAAVIAAATAAGGAAVIAAATPAVALGSVEAQIGQFDQQGIIHVDRLSATLLAAENLLVRDGQRLTTVLGTPVSVGAYPAAAAGKMHVLGTGQTVVYRSGVASYAAIDHAINDWSVLAERSFLVGFDCDAVVATSPIPGVTP